MPFNLSDVGLVQRGMNEGQEAQNRLAIEEQQVKTGQMGLEEATRVRDTQAKMRSAVSAADQTQGRAGVYHAVSKAALGAGDIAGYEQAQKASRALQDEGFGQLAMHAITGTPPDQAAKQFNETGVGRVVPESLEYGRDPKSGDILVRGVSVQDGKPYTFNATQYARLHGIIKPTVHSIPAGGSLAITEPGQPTQVVGGRDKAFSPSQSVIHVERTSEDGGKKTYAYDMEKKSWIGGAPPGEAGAPPEAEGTGHIRKNLPVLKAVDEAISKIPGAVNKMDLSDPLHPYYEWTPKGQAYSVRAQRLYLANPKLPPEQIREIVASPELQAKIVDGEEAELRFKGKTYKLGTGPAPQAAPAQAPAAAAPAATTPAPAAPAAAPQAVPAEAPKPKVEPKPEPKVEPKPKEKPGLQTVKPDDDELPKVVEVPKGSNPRERIQSDRARAEKDLAGRKDVVDVAAKAGRAVVDKLKPAQPDQVFRDIVASGRMTANDAPLIEEAISSGKLAPAEELKAHRMLAKLRPTVAGR